MYTGNEVDREIESSGEVDSMNIEKGGKGCIPGAAVNGGTDPSSLRYNICTCIYIFINYILCII